MASMPTILELLFIYKMRKCAIITRSCAEPPLPTKVFLYSQKFMVGYLGGVKEFSVICPLTMRIFNYSASSPRDGILAAALLLSVSSATPVSALAEHWCIHCLGWLLIWTWPCLGITLPY